MRVGLIGPPEREEIQRLAIRLEERGAEAVLLDPREPRVHIAPGHEEACGQGLARIGAFFVADLALSPPRQAEEDPMSRSRRLEASRRRLAVWTTLLGRLALRCKVVNPPATWDLHGLKPFEAFAYRRMDLPAPRTIATSSPAALLELPGDVDSWITKGLVGGYGYTERFQPPRSLDEARALLAAGPRLVQERIDGENVRAFVAGGEVLGAAEVIAGDPGEIDSRRGTVRLRRIELPEEARRAALGATRRFGLLFSAVDFMREATTGSFWLLECNSAPFFVEFERTTGIDVSSALADFLTERRRARAEAAP